MSTTAAPVAAVSTTGATVAAAASGRTAFLSIAEQKLRAAERARAAKQKKKMKAALEVAKKKQEAVSGMGDGEERWEKRNQCMHSPLSLPCPIFPNPPA